MKSAIDLPLEQAELSFTASGDARIRRTVLPNGVRILSESVPGVRSATVGYWVGVGSRDETGDLPASRSDDGREHPSTYGSTHFLEHLLFKGTNTRSALDIAVSFDAVGGEHNALTAKEYTCYYAKVQDRDLPMAIEVIADMLTSSIIDPDEFENERGVILEELSMSEDDPSDAVNERFFEAVLGAHPLGRPIGGNPATINAATRSAVWQHYRANYSASDLVVTAAGAVDHDALVREVSAALTSAGWNLDQAAAPRPRRSASGVPVARGAAVRTVQRPIEQVNILLGSEGIVATDPRRSTMAVLNSVLGGGMSSRLFQEVRERRGLAYSVYSFGAGYADAGVFGMYAGCAPAKARQVSELLLGELGRLASDPITDDELRRARGQISGGAALALEDSDTRMSRLGRSELSLGEFADLDEAERRLQRVTPADVHELASELVDRPLSIAAVGNVDDAVFDGVIDSPDRVADSAADVVDSAAAGAR